jgi:hypothetical protein
MSERGVDNMLRYCLSVAQEFQARMNRMRVFVKHNLSSGTANEIILREFLAGHSSGDYHVGQGFISDPTEEDKVSKQCDILVFDQNRYPIVYSDGPIKVVWPEAVRMVIEVKTNLNKEDIETGLENILSAKTMNPYLYGVIFAFQSPSNLDTVINNLANYQSRVSPRHGPTAILLLDKGIIIHSWSWERRRDLEAAPETDPNTYAIRAGKSSTNGIVVAFLLLLFYDAIGQTVGVFHADMVNMLMQMFDLYTERVQEDIFIGKANE